MDFLKLITDYTSLVSFGNELLTRIVKVQRPGDVRVDIKPLSWCAECLK